MENKNLIILCIAIVAIAIIVAAAIMYSPEEEKSVPENNTTNNTSTIINEVEEDSNYGKDSNIVKEEIKFNYQAGEGYYKEITYKDGNFRQYDTQTGKLIGSSFQSDADKLPSME